MSELQKKIKQVEMTIHVPEIIDLLDEIQEPGNIDEPEKRHRNGRDARRVFLGNELSHTQTKDK